MKYTPNKIFTSNEKRGDSINSCPSNLSEKNKTSTSINSNIKNTGVNINFAYNNYMTFGAKNQG